MLIEASTCQQATMRFQQGVDGNRAGRLNGIQPPDHGVDVAEHLGGRRVAGVFAALARGVGAEQPPPAHVEAFDAGRGDRLGTEQQAGEGFGPGERGRRYVEPHEGGLGVSDVGGDITVEDEPPAGQWVGQVDRVGAGPPVTPGQSGGRALPKSLFQAGHGGHVCSSITYILEHTCALFKVGGTHHHSPSRRHHRLPAPSQITMFTTLMSAPSFHQVPMSTFPDPKSMGAGAVP